MALAVTYQTLFPLTAISIEIVGSIQQSAISLSPLMVIYSLGGLLLVLRPVASLRFRLFPETYLDLAKASWNAGLVVFLVSLPTLLFSSSPSIGVGLVLVSFGSIWLPSASAIGSYSHLLGSESGTENLVNARKRPYSYTGLLNLFLAILLRRFELVKDIWKTALFLLALVISDVAGWILLSFSRGFPGTLIGMSTIVITPFVSYFSFRRQARGESRRRISDRLSAIFHPSPE